jgi:hypothetical protein
MKSGVRKVASSSRADWRQSSLPCVRSGLAETRRRVSAAFCAKPASADGFFLQVNVARQDTEPFGLGARADAGKKS